MVVYIDLLLLDNFCADAALLYCAVRTVRGQAKPLRIACTALAGAAAAVGYTLLGLYVSIPPPADFFIKYAVAALLPLPAAKFRRKRTYALCSLAFLGYMAAFAGVLTALFSADMPAAGEAGLVYTFGGLPSGGAGGGVRRVRGAGRAPCARSGGAGASGGGEPALRFGIGGAKGRGAGLCRYGQPPPRRSGRARVVADRAAALALLRGRIAFGDGTGGEAEEGGVPGDGKSGPLRGGRIAVHTVSGTAFFPWLRIDRLEIYCGKRANIIEDVTVAVSPRPLAGEYGALLPPEYADISFSRQGRERKRCCKRSVKCSGIGRKR